MTNNLDLGEYFPAPTPRRKFAEKLVHEDKEKDLSLYQNGVNSFKVVYGKQVKAGLTYAAACFEYGACFFHALACEGKIENS